MEQVIAHPHGWCQSSRDSDSALAARLAGPPSPPLRPGARYVHRILFQLAIAADRRRRALETLDAGSVASAVRAQLAGVPDVPATIAASSTADVVVLMLGASVWDACNAPDVSQSYRELVVTQGAAVDALCVLLWESDPSLQLAAAATGGDGTPRGHPECREPPRRWAAHASRHA